MAPSNSQSISINGQGLWELLGSGALSYRDGKMEGTRLFLCAWEDRADAIVALLGTYRRLADGTLIWTHRPDAFPGRPELVAKELSSEGIGAMSRDTDEAPLYDYAKLTVTYRQQEYSEDTGGGGGTEEEEKRFEESETTSWRAEFITVPAGGVVWAAGPANAGKPLLESMAVPIGIIERRFMKRDLISIPRTTIAATLNKVNADAFYGSLSGFVLFVGAEATKKMTADGKTAYDITYTFKERNIEWNKAWNPVSGGFAFFIASSGSYVFPEADFDALQIGTA